MKIEAAGSNPAVCYGDNREIIKVLQYMGASRLGVGILYPIHRYLIPVMCESVIPFNSGDIEVGLSS